MSPAEIIAEWASRGRRLDVAAAGTSVWEEGSGAPVVCLHGVPSSAFLYRKLLPQLAARSCRGIAFDLPGLGLADRPEDFDYSWSGLAKWTVAAVDALGLDRFHLVLHDIGGPIAFDVAARAPDRIASLTALNTMVRVASFNRPWSMEPFAPRGIGELYLKTMHPIERHGEHVREALGVDVIVRLHGRHFVQEDAPAEIAEHVAGLAA